MCRPRRRAGAALPRASSSPRRARSTATCAAASASHGRGSPSPGLNPHAGEGGVHGQRGRRRDRAGGARFCAPRASTPSGRWRGPRCSMPARAPRYDVALCMYHDRALIPTKTLAFDRNRQCDARPALHPYLARPWHRLRHRRHRQGRFRPASGAALSLADELARHEADYVAGEADGTRLTAHGCTRRRRTAAAAARRHRRAWTRTRSARSARTSCSIST